MQRSSYQPTGPRSIERNKPDPNVSHAALNDKLRGANPESHSIFRGPVSLGWDQGRYGAPRRGDAGSELTPELVRPQVHGGRNHDEKGVATCWMCDHPGSTREDYLAEVRAKMLRRGWTVQYVESDRVPFAYTIRLTRHDLPELLVTGVSPQRALRLLNGVARKALRDGPPMPGAQITLPVGPLVEVVEVEHPDAHMYCAVDIFGTEIRGLQLVWADGSGRRPWASNFNNGRGGQPVLGVRAVGHRVGAAPSLRRT
jgi:hypothetical protein